MYAERGTRMPHVVAWRSVVPPGGGGDGRVLPDGCLDVIWQDGAVFVAGPDTAARLAPAAPGSRFFALRFAAGTGPRVLDVPADEVTDRFVALDDLLPAAEVRRLSEAADPAAALEAFALRRWQPPDPAMVALAAGARAGRPVAELAGACGLSARHLQRRCAAAFGYGPKTLTRILRLGRALDLARRGVPYAEISFVAGYADQAHLARDVRALAGAPLGVLLPAGAAAVTS